MSKRSSGGRRSLEERERDLKSLREQCEAMWENYFAGRGLYLPHNELRKHCVEIREAVRPIIELQDKIIGKKETQPSDRQTALNRFLEWADKTQILRKGVSIFCVDNGFELRATEPLNPRWQILSLPRKACITFDLIRKGNQLKTCFEQNILVHNSEECSISLYLACQKLEANSRWQPYFDILPKDFDMPLYYTEEELQSLAPSIAEDDARIHCCSLVRQWIYFMCEAFKAQDYMRSLVKRRTEAAPILCATPITPLNFTFELFRWCFACVITRVTTMPSQDRDAHGQYKVIPCLFPYVDMARRSSDSVGGTAEILYIPDPESINIFAKKKYEVGEVISIDFGKRNSADYLVNCGMVPEISLENNSCKIRVGFPAKRLETDIRLKLMEPFGVSFPIPNVFYFAISGGEEIIPRELMYFTRIFVIENPTEKQDLEDKKLVKEGWKYLKQRVSIMYNAYKNFQPSEDTPFRQKQIMKMKNDERIIYGTALKYCEDVLQKLEEDGQAEEGCKQLQQEKIDDAPRKDTTSSSKGNEPLPDVSREDLEMKKSMPADESRTASEKPQDFSKVQLDLESVATKDEADVDEEK